MDRELARHDWTKEDKGEYRKAICRKSQIKRREIARANGICSICCKLPARAGKKTCQECTDRAIRAARNKTAM
jgi:hypothetical protein